MSRLIKKLSRYKKTLFGTDFFRSPEIDCNKLPFGNQFANWTFNPDNINAESIVYSFGIGTDISFDVQMIQKFGLKVFAYDPTPKSIEWLKTQNVPANFMAQQIGLADFNGEISFHLPENENYVSCSIIDTEGFSNEKSVKAKVLTLITLMEQNGHQKIDILKMDIEGAEYDVIKNIVNSDLKISQILIEFHHRFKDVGIKKTIEAIDILNKFGFKIFFVSESGEEYSFIKT